MSTPRLSRSHCIIEITTAFWLVENDVSSLVICAAMDAGCKCARGMCVRYCCLLPHVRSSVERSHATTADSHRTLVQVVLFTLNWTDHKSAAQANQTTSKKLLHSVRLSEKGIYRKLLQFAADVFFKQRVKSWFDFVNWRQFLIVTQVSSLFSQFFSSFASNRESIERFTLVSCTGCCVHFKSDTEVRKPIWIHFIYVSFCASN